MPIGREFGRFFGIDHNADKDAARAIEEANAKAKKAAADAAESKRIADEATRQAAEAKRLAAEAKRQAAEAKRQAEESNCREEAAENQTRQVVEIDQMVKDGQAIAPIAMANILSGWGYQEVAQFMMDHCPVEAQRVYVRLNEDKQAINQQGRDAIVRGVIEGSALSLAKLMSARRYREAAQLLADGIVVFDSKRSLASAAILPSLGFEEAVPGEFENARRAILEEINRAEMIPVAQPVQRVEVQPSVVQEETNKAEIPVAVPIQQPVVLTSGVPMAPDKHDPAPVLLAESIQQPVVLPSGVPMAPDKHDPAPAVLFRSLTSPPPYLPEDVPEVLPDLPEVLSTVSMHFGNGR